MDDLDLIRCERVHEYNNNRSEQCRFVRGNADCQCAEGFFNYIEFIFCNSNEGAAESDIVESVAVCAVWSCFLFVVLGLTANKFFCPSLTVIAKSLNLSQNVAVQGVTFLAFGNGASDIFASLAAATQNRPELVISGLFGAGIFVTCAVAGAIMICNSFTINEIPFLRDVIFYLASAYWAFTVYYCGTVRPLDAFGFLGLYGVYILVVLCGPCLYKRLTCLPVNNSDVDVETANRYAAIADLSHRFSTKAMINETTPLLKQQSGDSRSEVVHSTSRWLTCLMVLSPIDVIKWQESRWHRKTLDVVKAPAVLLLKLTVPVIDYDKPCYGWSQILNSFHCVVGPLFLIFATRNTDVVVGGSYPLLAIVFVVGLLLAVLVLLTSSHPQPPKYYTLFGYLGFAVSIVWIYIMANEIVNVLTVPVSEVMGIVLNINDAILGLTILAWGNSIGDFVANFSVAKKGSPMMAMSACYGGPLFNLLVGMGLPFTIETLRRPNAIKVSYDPSVTILSVFLFASLLSTLVAMLFTSFRVVKQYGFYLLFLYVTFVTCAVVHAVHG